MKLLVGFVFIFNESFMYYNSKWEIHILTEVFGMKVVLLGLHTFSIEIGEHISVFVLLCQLFYFLCQ